MRNKILALGVLSMAVLANAQTRMDITPTASNTNTLSACETAKGFYQFMDGTRASLALQFGNSGPLTNVLSTTWRDTLYMDTVNGVGTRAVFKVGESSTDIRARYPIADFDVRISFRNTNNSGFFYRGKMTTSPPYNTAIEVGIDNNTNALVREQTGSVFDIFPPQPLQAVTQHTYASGRWNELRIIAIDDSVEHWVNGIRVIAYRMFSDNYFAGNGLTGATGTGYTNSKWNGNRTMSYEVATNRSAGPIKRGLIGIQGAHPGNMYIRNFRIDTTLTWASNSVYPDTGANCGPTSVGKPGVTSKAAIRVSYVNNNKVSIAIPGYALKEASLVDAFGRVHVSARINGQSAEFEKLNNGVYFLRYRNGSGSQTARVGLVGLR